MALRRVMALPGLAFGAMIFGVVACGSAPTSSSGRPESTPETAASATVPAAALQARVASPTRAAGQSPLPLGYYAVNSDCAVAMKDGLGILIDRTHWSDIDGDYELLPVEDLGGGKFKLGEAADTLRQTGPTSFVADEGTDHERALKWCAEKRPS